MLLDEQEISIHLGSTSQRKKDAVLAVFGKFWKKQNIRLSCSDIESGVPQTPYEEETYTGAKNRALACQKEKKTTFSVGVESGLVMRHGTLYEETWAYIVDKEGNEFSGYSSGLPVPLYVLQKMALHNQEHHEIMKEIEETLLQTNSETWGAYTGNLVQRQVSLEESLRNAVVQIVASKKIDSLYAKTLLPQESKKE